MKIRVGSPPLSFYAVQGAVVCAVLERAGYTTEHIMAFHEEIYPQLGSGEIDVFCATWLPSGHASLWAPIENCAVKLGRLFCNGGFHLAVPNHLAADGIRTIRDLVRFENIDRKIVSVGPGGATLTHRARTAAKIYGLEEVGYSIQEILEADWAKEIMLGASQNRRFAAAIWRPSFINVSANLTILEDPEGAMGPQDDGWVTANHRFLQTAPNEVKYLLEKLYLGLEEIEELDAEVVNKGHSPLDVATAWLSNNQTRVDQLIAEFRQSIMP